ncbi:hypothetical protein KR200_001485 [Drosophila serrata]|nr:hypothetical protein KR200_001485 [Drosophila serrata]
MANFVDSFAHRLWPLRQYHCVVAKASLLGLILFGGLDYGYKVHGMDLLYWRGQLATFSPLSILLYIIAAKVSVILALALESCIRLALVKKEPRRREMPFSCLRERYIRYVLMQLLADLDEMVLEPETMDLANYLHRHADLNEAVRRFRYRARRIYERTDLHFLVPQHVILNVDDQQEAELLSLGYADRLEGLREEDFYRMVFGNLT